MLDGNKVAPTACPTCSGEGRFDCSGPGYPGIEVCETCDGEGSVYVCRGCETSYAADSRDAELIEYRGQCASCLAYDAVQASKTCGGCRQPATRRDAYDVADVCDICGEDSDSQCAASVHLEKRLAAMELI